MTKKTIEIFRVGSHTGMNGKTYDFTREHLLATAAAYDPAVFSAPLVIGHPKHQDPAYGWATAMRVPDPTEAMSRLFDAAPVLFASAVVAVALRHLLMASTSVRTAPEMRRVFPAPQTGQPQLTSVA